MATNLSTKREGGAKLVDLNFRQETIDREGVSVENCLTLEELIFVLKIEPSRSTSHKIHGVKSWVCM